MGIVFGLLAAATYGAADFIGGRASRRVDVFVVVFVSQLIGTIPLLLVLPFFEEQPLSGPAVAWGAAAGIGGATGVLLLYRGLAIGRMSVIAPVTGVVAAVAPVIFGLATGERPSALALIGVIVALMAVALVSSAPPPATSEASAPLDLPVVSWRTNGVPLALGAGLAFGAFFIFLDRAGDQTGVWPLVGSRASSLILVGAAVGILRKHPRPPSGTTRMIGGAGVLDVAANIFYLLATRHGLLSLVAVLTSMYPASTVLLARVVLDERLARTQVVGLLFAAASIVLIVLG
ncbi:MAG: DMT family transporter [Actinomycetota bacterium]|nr:DMT family transporter [Actinomycetota bacterium]